MPKPIESMVNLYVKLKDRKSLQSLLDGRQNTYDDFKRLNASEKFLDELTEEIEIIKAALEGIKDGEYPLREAQPEVKVTGIAVSARPSTAPEGSSPQVLGGDGATSVVVTGLSISVSPAPAETDLSLPPDQVRTKDS